MGMLYARETAETSEQQTRKQQQQRYIRNDEKWHIGGEDFPCSNVLTNPN